MNEQDNLQSDKTQNQELQGRLLRKLDYEQDSNLKKVVLLANDELRAWQVENWGHITVKKVFYPPFPTSRF